MKLKIQSSSVHMKYSRPERPQHAGLNATQKGSAESDLGIPRWLVVTGISGEFFGPVISAMLDK